jgi:hypothetical protein
LDHNGLSDYAELCAWTIAKAHARTGDRVAISAHIGKVKRFAQNILDEASEHAQLNAIDYSRLIDAMARGEIASEASA